MFPFYGHRTSVLSSFRDFSRAGPVFPNCRASHEFSLDDPDVRTGGNLLWARDGCAEAALMVIPTPKQNIRGVVMDPRDVAPGYLGVPKGPKSVELTCRQGPPAHEEELERGGGASGYRENHRCDLFRITVFSAATICKAIEPVLIDLSQEKPGSTHGDGYEFSITLAIACAEALKAVVCLLLIACGPKRQHGHYMDFTFAPERIRPFVIPAVLLAIANQTLFFGISALGALLNQIVRKAVCILATALLARALLGQQLNNVQRISLMMLTFGFILLLPRASALGEVDVMAVLSNPGLIPPESLLRALVVLDSSEGGPATF